MKNFILGIDFTACAVQPLQALAAEGIEGASLFVLGKVELPQRRPRVEMARLQHEGALQVGDGRGGILRERSRSRRGGDRVAAVTLGRADDKGLGGEWLAEDPDGDELAKIGSSTCCEVQTPSSRPNLVGMIGTDVFRFRPSRTLCAGFRRHGAGRLRYDGLRIRLRRGLYSVARQRRGRSERHRKLLSSAQFVSGALMPTASGRGLGRRRALGIKRIGTIYAALELAHMHDRRGAAPHGLALQIASYLLKKCGGN